MQSLLDLVESDDALQKDDVKEQMIGDSSDFRQP